MPLCVLESCQWRDRMPAHHAWQHTSRPQSGARLLSPSCISRHWPVQQMSRYSKSCCLTNGRFDYIPPEEFIGIVASVHIAGQAGFGLNNSAHEQHDKQSRTKKAPRSREASRIISAEATACIAVPGAGSNGSKNMYTWPASTPVVAISWPSYKRRAISL